MLANNHPKCSSCTHWIVDVRGVGKTEFGDCEELGIDNTHCKFYCARHSDGTEYVNEDEKKYGKI